MLNFIDFFPEVAQKGSIFKADKYEALDQPLQRMNDWIKNNPQFTVLNVETVVLPNIHLDEGTLDPHLVTGGETSSNWHQFFRVWYREGNY